MTGSLVASDLLEERPALHGNDELKPVLHGGDGHAEACHGMLLPRGIRNPKWKATADGKQDAGGVEDEST